METLIRFNVAEIDRLRDIRNIPSRAKLAEAAGMHPQLLSRILVNPDIDWRKSALNRLCGALHCMPWDILIYEPDDPADGDVAAAA